MKSERIDPDQVLKHLRYLYEIRQQPITPLEIVISMARLSKMQELMYILSQMSESGVITKTTLGTAAVVAYEPIS